MMIKSYNQKRKMLNSVGNPIDSNIFNFIIKMNALPFLETTWSCGGHPFDDCMGFVHNILCDFKTDKSEESNLFIGEFKKIIFKHFFDFGMLEDYTETEIDNKYYAVIIKELRYPLTLDKESNLRDYQFASKQEKEVIFNQIYGSFVSSLELFVDEWLERTCGNETVQLIELLKV